MPRPLPSITADTRHAFLQYVRAHRPREYSDAETALDQLIAWSLDYSSQLTPLAAGDQDTVAFGLKSGTVLWRAYPGKTVPAKIAMLPGHVRKLDARQRDPLVRLLTVAVPGTTIAPGAHLQIPLAKIAGSERFATFSSVLEAAAKIGHTLP